METITLNGNKFLTLPTSSLVALVLVGEVSVYWIDEMAGKVEEVKDPQTIYGGCPNCFGIKIA